MQRHYFAYKGPSNQGYDFSSGHVWMWELNCEESWAPKNWCIWTVVLEKSLESPLDCKEIQPVHSEGNQPWDFFGRKDAKAETQVLWPPHAKSWLIEKDPDAGRDWGQEEKGTTEDEMAGWHHWLDGHEFEWTPELVMDREAWHAKIIGVAKSRTWLSVRFNFYLFLRKLTYFLLYNLESLTTCSSPLYQKIVQDIGSVSQKACLNVESEIGCLPWWGIRCGTGSSYFHLLRREWQCTQCWPSAVLMTSVASYDISGESVSSPK